MRHRFLALFAAAMLSFGFVLPAQAALLITVDKTAQRMTVELDGAELFNWPVSTGIRGHDTPVGEFKPFRMEADHYSREWDDAPMPHSIFFTMNGHAIHGTDHVKALGAPASKGCVRLSRANAKILFDLVRQEKMANTKVVLRGTLPETAPAVARRNAPAATANASADDIEVVDDDGFVSVMPAAPRRRVVVRENWREYNDGQRYYYYRAPPPQYVQPQQRYVQPRYAQPQYVPRQYAPRTQYYVQPDPYYPYRR
ncbi:MAG: L,D-transpeptidase [Pseudolabrys sp.]|nr:L,D-transpeptidase [Pseudolabrys sp.]